VVDCVDDFPVVAVEHRFLQRHRESGQGAAMDRQAAGGGLGE